MFGTPGDWFLAVANKRQLRGVPRQPRQAGRVRFTACWGGAARVGQVATSAGRDPHLLMGNSLDLAQAANVMSIATPPRRYATTSPSVRARSSASRSLCNGLRRRAPADMHYVRANNGGNDVPDTVPGTATRLGELHPGVSAQWAGQPGGTVPWSMTVSREPKWHAATLSTPNAPPRRLGRPSPSSTCAGHPRYDSPIRRSCGPGDRVARWRCAPIPPLHERRNGGGSTLSPEAPDPRSGRLRAKAPQWTDRPSAPQRAGT